MTVPSLAGPVNILRGIDLDIQRNEALALIGPSGSGKTSLLMLMAGLERASGGGISIDNQAIEAMDEDRLARLRRTDIGIVFQAFHLIPTMTALENVLVRLELAGRADAIARARAALESVGLGHRLTHRPGQLSGGEQQMLSIGRALMLDPSLLLLDEPLEGLAPVVVDRLLAALTRIRDESGAAIVLVEQHARLALEFSDAATVLDHGEVVFAGSARALLDDPERLGVLIGVGG